MAQPRAFASLSPGLLARKGAARPAMRPQGFAPAGVAQAAPLDDLGWNDMGQPQPQPATPGPAGPSATDPVFPQVLVEREDLARAIEAPAPVAAVSPATAARLRRETAHAGKAAFTLRLDADRHLKLRLASAVTNQSAQTLMLHALDALIATTPSVEALVAALPPVANRKR